LIACSEANSTAPAPSESIQRRKSFSKAISGWLSRSSTRLSYSALKLRACISVEATSDPQATALRLSPLATLIQAYFSALMPHRQIPAVDTTSQGGLPSSP